MHPPSKFPFDWVILPMRPVPCKRLRRETNGMQVRWEWPVASSGGHDDETRVSDLPERSAHFADLAINQTGQKNSSRASSPSLQARRYMRPSMATEIFGDDLAADPRFMTAVAAALDRLIRLGSLSAVAHCLQSASGRLKTGFIEAPGRGPGPGRSRPRLR